MTEWLLILVINGASVDSVKVPDRASCVRASKAFTNASQPGNRPQSAVCVEITKEKKWKKNL